MQEEIRPLEQWLDNKLKQASSQACVMEMLNMETLCRA